MRKRSDPFARVRKLGLALANAEEGTSFGAPALKVRGKMFACMATNRSAEPNTLVVRVSFLERDLRLRLDPTTYYLTPHYVDYESVLARLDRIDDDALADLLETGWQFVNAGSKKRRRATDQGG